MRRRGRGNAMSSLKRYIFAQVIECRGSKVDSEMTFKIKSSCQDGLFSFSLLHRWFMETSGDGLAEKRVYVMNPQQAKQESEIYLPFSRQMGTRITRLTKGGGKLRNNERKFNEICA